MATAAAIAAHVTEVASLASSGTEQTRVYEWMNEGYRRAVAESGCLAATPITVNLTAGTADYDIATLLGVTNVAQIRRMLVSGNGLSGYPLTAKNANDLMERRYSSANAGLTGVPAEYAIDGLNLLMLWPSPQSGVTLTAYYDKYPKTLSASTADASNETTPTAFPAELHEPIIENYALFKAFSYRGNMERANAYFDAFTEAVTRLSERVNEMIGDTPARVRVGRGRLRRRYPDVF